MIARVLLGDEAGQHELEHPGTSARVPTGSIVVLCCPAAPCADDVPALLMTCHHPTAARAAAG